MVGAKILYIKTNKKRTLVIEMSEKRILKIICPKCGKPFKEQLRTKKMAKDQLIKHLKKSKQCHHNFNAEEATLIADRYLESQ